MIADEALAQALEDTAADLQLYGYAGPTCLANLRAAAARLRSAETRPLSAELVKAREAIELLRDMILATTHGQTHRESMHDAIMAIAPFLRDPAAPALPGETPAEPPQKLRDNTMGLSEASQRIKRVITALEERGCLGDQNDANELRAVVESLKSTAEAAPRTEQP